MASTKKRMVLAVLPTSAPFSWRHPNAEALGDLSFEFYRRLVKTAERGKLDIFFLADRLSLREDGMGIEGMKGFGTVVDFEALTLLSALAAVTTNIGLIATVSTTYNQPYHVARKLASIDHISKGRAGWNVITSGQDSEANNFGLDEQLSTEARYERAEEFLNVVLDLWDSWEDDAIVKDRSAGLYFQPDRVHRLDHLGKYFKVRGPLNLSRPPQGHPLISQAGASEAGWEFAAKTADILYGKAISLQEAQRFYRDVKGRLAKYGRSPDCLKILPGLIAVVGETEKEARDKFHAVQHFLSEEEARSLLAHFFPGADFSNAALDETMPSTPEVEKGAARHRLFVERNGHRLSIREVVDYFSAGFGHLPLVGTPGQIADTMLEWLVEDGADGFNLMPHSLPQGLEDFVNFVVPELQERGVFRRKYEGGTLRENLGLPKPQRRQSVAR